MTLWTGRLHSHLHILVQWSTFLATSILAILVHMFSNIQGVPWQGGRDGTLRCLFEGKYLWRRKRVLGTG